MSAPRLTDGPDERGIQVLQYASVTTDDQYDIKTIIGLPARSSPETPGCNAFCRSPLLFRSMSGPSSRGSLPAEIIHHQGYRVSVQRLSRPHRRNVGAFRSLPELT